MGWSVLTLVVPKCTHADGCMCRHHQPADSKQMRTQCVCACNWALMRSVCVRPLSPADVS
eukprot:15473584-Alexandrium_andersonii.AAC.1